MGKNEKRQEQSTIVIYNTTNVGPVLYLVPVRQKDSVNAPVKGVRKPKRKFKDDDEEDKDVVRVDES